MRWYARMFSRKEGEEHGGFAMQTTTELLTSVQLAERLGLRPDTIRLWTRANIIPAIRITGKVIRYDPIEVNSALRRRSNARSNNGGEL